jgi:hypothetical protein
MNGKDCAGLNPLVSLDGLGWYKIWDVYPFIVLAVGRINDTLIPPLPGFEDDVEHMPTKWHPSGPWKIIPKPYIPPSPRIGGLLADNKQINLLLERSSEVYSATFRFHRVYIILYKLKV